MFQTKSTLPTPLIQIKDNHTATSEVSLYIKRDDLVHPEISGNKWRKLKYNLLKSEVDNLLPVITFGGAFSNHLYATASACHEAGLPSVGIVRGDELNALSTPTLTHCQEKGMDLYFVSRSEYRQKNAGKTIQSILRINKNASIIPEGGANEYGMKGMAELPSEITAQLGYTPDFLSIAAGTGSSAAGLLAGSARVIAFAVLKGGAFLRKDIYDFVNIPSEGEALLDLQTDYHFGGYGKHTPELLRFMSWFEKTHGIPLEQVYTGKMLFGLYELIKKKYFPSGSTIVAIHTGGLQGRLKTLPDAPFKTDFK